MLLAVGVSFWVAARVSGPLRRLRDTVRRFGPENLGLRVQVTSRDELGELGTAFNRMADRLAENAGELRYLAYYDPLTHLPNGAAFKEHLAGAIERADRTGSPLAVLFLDLHRFKRVNDTLGHDQGDALLTIVADRLNVCLRELDGDAGGPRPERILSRMGGDHFMLLLESFGQTANVADFAQTLNERCSEPVLLGAHEISVQTSIGVSLFPMDGRDVHTLLKNADTAKQHAKAHGGLPYRFYSRALTVQAAEFMSLESDLRHALERDELRLFAQPQVDVQTGRVCGAEVLLRWEHPERGLVSPAVFVPLAEVTGLIVPIGEWVIRRACREARAWQEVLDEPLRVGINISGVQFRPDLVGIVERAIAESSLEPELVDLEITETVVMRTAEATISTLNQLKAMGVSLSIDDFGTGYSSLSYLKRFPIDRLKIDRSFMNDVTVRSEDGAITRAIVAMGHGLGFRVIAEGVETRTHLEFLEAAGCDEAQGYIFSRPVPAGDIPALVRELSRRAA
jgi:diguanylate cyclase (GGDEF)-like protein